MALLREIYIKHEIMEIHFKNELLTDGNVEKTKIWKLYYRQRRKLYTLYLIGKAAYEQKGH